MENREKLNILESRQLELQRIMSSSDAHASKCPKLGLSFAETYPEELSAYVDARNEYNLNEVQIEELKAAIEAEELEPGPKELQEE